MAGIDRDRIDPEFLMDLSDPVGRVYEAIEHDLLVNVARRFKGGSQDTDYLSWDAKMLAQLGALTEENIKIIASYMADADVSTELALQTSLNAALDSIEPELAKMVNKPGYVPTRTQTTDNIMTAYKAQALNTRNMVNTVMLNSSLEVYRKTVSAASADYEAKLAKAQQTLNQETGAVATGSKTRKEAVTAAVRRMATDGLTGFQDRTGRTWSAQAYVNMDVRTTTANIANEATLKRNEDYGNNLIAISSHVGARPKCAPYQGYIYSTDGTSGTVHDLHGKAISYTPLSGTSYGEPDGIFGINCGHRPYPFVDGVSLQTFEPYDKAENDEAYKKSQQQRYMERKIRASKSEADQLEAAGDTEGAKAARKKARSMNSDLKSWCADNGMTYKQDRVSIVRPQSQSAKLDMLKGQMAEQAKIDAAQTQEPEKEKIYQEIPVRVGQVGTTAVLNNIDKYPESDPDTLTVHLTRKTYKTEITNGGNIITDDGYNVTQTVDIAITRAASVLGGEVKEGQYYRLTNNKNEVKLVESGKLRPSVNHLTNQPETGLSTWEAMEYSGYKYAYRVSGTVIDRGSDGEPVLDMSTLKPIGKIRTMEDMKAETQAMRENGFTRIEEEFGWTRKQIMQARYGGFKKIRE